MPRYTVRWDRSAITLPSHSGDAWDDAAFISDYKLAHRVVARSDPPAGHTPDAPARVPVRLIPRPDNDYNQWAVSLAAPPNLGGDAAAATSRVDVLEARHLGFLYDAYLEQLGMQTLHRLARFSTDGEIRCHADIAQCGGELHGLALPDPATLRAAIQTFLSDPATPPLRSRHALTKLLGVEAHGTQETRTTLDMLGTFTEPARPLGDLTASTARDGDTLQLRLREAATGRSIGHVTGSILFLHDERDRPAALTRVADLGIPVVQPAPVHPAGAGKRGWPVDQVPNTWTYWFADGLDFRPRDPANSPPGSLNLASILMSPRPLRSRTRWAMQPSLLAEVERLEEELHEARRIGTWLYDHLEPGGSHPSWRRVRVGVAVGKGRGAVMAASDVDERADASRTMNRHGDVHVRVLRL